MNSLMIRASAGSGKTFQLSNRFLALLAAGALPTELIALTFTRKAAGEFADRILSRLADGAMDDATALSLADQLADTLIGNQASGMPPLHAGRELPLPDLARFRELLEGLARDLHRISLSTLDSFFVRIAKQFPYELGIGSFELLEADDLKAEKKQVLARIFREVTERQREAFLGAFRLATHGKEHTRLSALLDDFLDDHHQRFLNSPEREKWGDLSFIWPQGCPWPHLTDFHTTARNVISLLGTVVVPKKAHATWIKGWDTTADFFSTYQPGDGRNPPTTVSRMLALLDDLRSGTATDLFNRIEHGIGGALAKAVTTLIGGYLRAELEVRSTRTVGLWTILYAYESIYEQTVRLRGRLGFSDVTRVLAQGGLTADGRARMESRLDARYSHWLLDEFQDTSRSQWSVLAGLADEAVMDSEERRSLFVVGDTKQGIYGWRGGEPRLFDDLLGLPGWDQRMSEWSMETSWRSAPQVLALVNRICDPQGPGMRERFPAAALQRWHFRPHLTSPGGEKLPGYTAVVEAGESDDNDEEGGPEAALRDLIATVQPLARGLSCAILVRSNKRARETADFLRHQFPAMAVEVDAEVELALDNPAGVALLDLFRWLAHPGDRMAWGHVAHSPLRLALRPDDEAGSWREYRDLINREGISGVIGRLFQILRAAASLTPFLEQRLEGIAREAHAYDETGDRSPESWLRRLEGLVQREYSSEGAIQIMTIHKAKGLEFDMVVAMDLAGGAFDDPSKAGILEFRDAAGLTGALLLPPKKEMLTADRDLRKLYGQWVADQCVERFCNLYVALTRARHATYVLLPKAPKNAPASEMRHDLWIRDAVGDAGEVVTWDGREWPALDLEGDPAWYERLRRTLPEEFVAEPPTELGAAVSRRPRSHPAGQYRTLSADSLEFGVAVHRAFEKTGWVDEELSPFPANPAEELVFELLEIPEIRARFECQGRSVELFREQPIDAILDGEWLSGVIDRLHVERDANGNVTAVEAIDFKTDAVDSPAELIARHRPQMKAYRQALEAAFSPAPVSCVLLSTHLKCWVEFSV